MKRLVSIFIVVLLICGFLSVTSEATFRKDPIPVSDKAETKINALDFAATSLLEGYYTDQANYVSNNPDIKHTGCIALVFGNYATYNLSVSRAGKYTITLYGQFEKDTLSVYVGDKLNQKAAFEKNTMLDGFELGTISLEKGENIVKIQSTSAINFFYFFTLSPYIEYNDSFIKNEGSYMDVKLPAVIQAENFNLEKSAYHSIDGVNDSGLYRPEHAVNIQKSASKEYYINLKKGEFTKYSFEVVTSGAYNFYISTKWGSKIDVYVDDAQYPISVELDIGKEFVENEVANIYLDKGIHTVKLLAKEMEVDVNYIKAVSGDKNYITVADLNIAKQESVKGNKVYKNLYVAPNGSDYADGSKDAPFATIERAKEEVTKINADMDGDIIVNIAEGLYSLEKTLEFTNEDSGRNGYNVIYRGTNIFNPPIISGGTRLTGWTQKDDKIWTIKTDDVDSVRRLYIDGFPARRATSKYTYTYKEAYHIPESEYEIDGLVIDKVNFPKKLSNFEDGEIVQNFTWINKRAKIEDFFYNEDGNPTFIVNRYIANISSSRSGNGFYAGNSVYLENFPELLDEPGEFYWDRRTQTISYYPYEGQDMTKAETYIGKVEGLVTMYGNSTDDRIKHISFDNISFRYGNWDYLEKSSYVTTQSDVPDDTLLDKDGNNSLHAQFDVLKAENISINNCEFACLGSIGIAMSDAVKNSKITNSIIRDAAGTGIRIGDPKHYTYLEGSDICRDIEISNNIVRRVADEMYGNCGIAVYYEKNIDIINNTIMDLPYTGISAGWGWEFSQSYAMSDVHINYNHIENIMQTLGDGGFVYTLGSCKDSTLIGNYFKDHGSPGYGGGVYFDAGSSWFKMDQNVILNASPYIQIQYAQYGTHDLAVTNTYTNYSNEVIHKSNNCSVEETKLVLEENLPDEALKIKTNAGTNNITLIAKTELPSYMELKLNTLPQLAYKATTPKIGLKIQAEDFMEGGEGVGYHKNAPGLYPNAYRKTGVCLENHNREDAEEYVIGTNFAGEWMNYEFDIPEDGEYYMDLATLQNWTDSTQCAKIYVDGQLWTSEVALANGSTYTANTVGKLNLTKGKHIIKVEFVQSFYFDYIELYTEGNRIGSTIRPSDLKEKTTDVKYDDAENLIKY